MKKNSQWLSSLFLLISICSFGQRINLERIEKPNSLNFSGFIGRPCEKITEEMTSSKSKEVIKKEYILFLGDYIKEFDLDQVSN